MKFTLKVTAAFLLFFNGTAAIFGGLNLIITPDGSSLNLPADLLKHAPFADYLIPGILLLAFNGLFSIFTLIWLILNRKNYPFFVMLDGVILTIWIIVQVELIHLISYMHVFLGLTGIALILCGRKIVKI